MVQCKKCKLFISKNKDDVMKCKSCDAHLHKKCVRNKALLENNTCQECNEDEFLPAESPTSLENKKMEKILLEINAKLEIMYSVQKKLDEITDAVDFYAEKYQQMLEYQEKTEKKITALHQKNTHLENCNKSLEERISYLETKSKENNIEIVGIEKKEGEDVKEIITNIAYKLKLEKSLDCVQEIKRVGSEKSDAKGSQPIIVSFTNKITRNEWIAQKKSNIVNSDIFHNNNKKRIYINEDIPKNIKKLLWITKTQLKSSYRYIWIQNGKILVRKDDENRKIYSIHTEADLCKLTEDTN